MTLSKQDKNDMVTLINQGITEVVLPAMDKMKEELLDELASKGDLRDVQGQLDTIERKLDAQQKQAGQALN